MGANACSACSYDVLIFRNIWFFIHSRIGSMDGFDYIQYMIPGLIMLSVITNSYINVVSSLFCKVSKSIEELLISPMPNWTILLGFVLGGVCREC